MTISTTASRISYTGNGSTVDFSFPYPVLLTTDLVIISTVIATGVETVQVITTDYTVALVGGGATATVTAVTAPVSTVTWTIYRDPPVTQTTDFTDNDPLPAASIEDALDKNTQIEQRSRSLVDRSLKQPEGDTADIKYLPSKVARASKYMAFDANGDPLATAGTGTVDSVSSIMIEDDAITLAKMAGGIDGNLITYDAAGDPAYVVTGAAAQVLTSNGAGAAPTFQTPAALAAGAVDTAELADNGVTLAKMAGGTDGNLITYDAAGNPAYVATGTAGQVLTSGGIGVAPTMQAPVGMDVAFIEKLTAAADSTLEFTGFNSSLYDNYLFIIHNMDKSSGAATAWMRVSTDAGSTWNSSTDNYAYFTGKHTSTDGGTTVVHNALSGVGGTSSYMAFTKEDIFGGTIWSYDPAGSGEPAFSWNIQATTTDAGSAWAGGGWRQATTAVNGLQFGLTVGTMSGSITMYGLVKA